MKILLIIALYYCVKLIHCQNCPYYSNIRNNEGQNEGRVEIANDYSGSYRIDVNMSVAAYLTRNENINIQLLSSPSSITNGDFLVYRVIFPIQNVVPKLTKLEFNNIVYCTDAPEQARPGVGVTNFWATQSFKTDATIRSPNPYYNTISTPAPSYTTIASTWQTPRRTTQRPTSRQTPRRTTQKPTSRQTTMPPQRRTQRPSTNRLSEDGCGKIVPRGISLIVSPDDVQPGTIPWMVSIMFRIDSSASFDYRCTGNIISAKHVITAAHCIQLFSLDYIEVSNLWVILGIVEIKNWHNGAKITVSSATAHPDYSPDTGDFDLAVLTLTTAIKYSSSIKPICIWEEDDDLDLIVNTSGRVSGWGSDEAGTMIVDQAKYVDFPVVSKNQCQNSNSKFENSNFDETFCAGKRDGTGPCNGDSGAGFMIFDKNNERWVLRGVLSRNLNDRNICDLNNYFVFADIAKARNWLQPILRG